MSRKGQRIIVGGASVAVLLCALSLDYVREVSKTLNYQTAALSQAFPEDEIVVTSDQVKNTPGRRVKNTSLPPTTVTTAGQAFTNTTIVESVGYAHVTEFPELLAVVSNLTSIVGEHLDESGEKHASPTGVDRQFIYKQVDAIYDSLSDSVDDTQENISALTASLNDLEDDFASLSASLTGLAFVEGGNAFGTTTVLGTTDNQPLSLITNGVERLTISEGGQVLIGTTTSSSQSQLQVVDEQEGGTNAVQIRARVNPQSEYGGGTFSTSLSAEITSASTNPYSPGLLMGGNFSVSHQGSAGIALLQGMNSTASNAASGTIVFATSLGASVRNEGTGTIPKAYGLTVSITNSASGTINNAYGVYINDLVGTNTWGLYQSHISDRNYFAGNVNIGTTATSTNSKLTVVSTNVASTTLRLESPRVAIVSGNILGGIDFASNDTTLTAPGTTTASILARANETHTASALGTDLIFSTTNGTTTAERMRILGNGNVGIGTSTPGQALTVAGTIQATNLLGGATNITTDASGNIIRDPSDERLKTNVNTLENALDIVLSLRGVSYEWRDAERFGDQTEIGFIAQEVDLVLPEVVQKGGEYWSLNRSNMVAVVVEAVKEIYARMEAYFAENDREIERLQNQNEVLNARVEALENALDIEVEPEEEETPVDAGVGDDTNAVGEPTGDETLVEPAAPPAPTEPEEPVEPQQPVEPLVGDEPPPSVPPTP